MTYTRPEIAAEYTATTIEPIADAETTFDFFRRHGDDLFDRWDGKNFVRVVRSGDVIGLLRITVQDDGRWEISGPAQTESELADLARRQFLASSLSTEDFYDLAPELVGKVERDTLRHSVIVRAASLFQSITRAVTAQLVNLEFAGQVRTLLAGTFGTLVEHEGFEAYWLDPLDIADTSIDQLREMKLTQMKCKCIIATAQAITGGDFDTADLAELSEAQLRKKLTSIPGIGRWTADWVMVRCFDRPMVAAGDLGVRKAIHWLFNLDERPSESEVRKLTKHWGEHASIIQSAVLEAFHCAI